jgi:hypothetical protein
MTPVRILDTQRLSVLAHEYERQMVLFYRDLLATGRGAERLRTEAEKVGFEEIRVDDAGHFLARIGTGRHVIAMDPRGSEMGIAAMLYAGKLINELGIYDDFTLWVGDAIPSGIRPGCLLIAEPTNLCIKSLNVDDPKRLLPLVRAAVETYEALFELPPIVSHATSTAAPKSVPAIAIGASEHGHLLQAAQFYAAFPMMFATTMRRR